MRHDSAMDSPGGKEASKGPGVEARRKGHRGGRTACGSPRATATMVDHLGASLRRNGGLNSRIVTGALGCYCPSGVEHLRSPFHQTADPIAVMIIGSPGVRSIPWRLTLPRLIMTSTG